MRVFFCSVCAILFMCHFAVAQKAEHLGKEVNSPYEEREPILSPDGNTIYFWRRNSPANTNGSKDPGDVWYAEQDSNGRWAEALRFGSPLNTYGHDFVWQVSADGDTLYMNRVYLKRGKKDAGLAYAIKGKNGWWQRQQPLYVEGYDQQGSYKDYFLTKTGELLIPNVVDDTYGGTDIYVCKRINDTTWARPINLGSTINTRGDEDAPYLSDDGRFLYFGSEGHGGLGGHDIFVSERLDDGWQNWSKPVNIGPPVSTPGYDFDFQISPKGDYAYWASDMNTFGSNDIFRLKLDDCELSTYPKGRHVICQGDTLMIESGFTVADGLLRYQWMRDGKDIAGATERNYVATKSGAYQVVREKDSCVRVSDTVFLKVLKRPVVAVKASSYAICPDDSVKLEAFSDDGKNYQWQKNGVNLPDAQDRVYYPKSPGSYTVKVSNKRCHTLSVPVQLHALDEPPLYVDQPGKEPAPPPSPILDWQWASELESKPADTYVRDLNASPGGFVASLSLQPDRKNFVEWISIHGPNGNLRFQKNANKLEFSGGNFVAVDEGAHVYVSSNAHYLCKYSPSGRNLWSLDQPMEKLIGLAVDPLGYVYTAGRFKDTLILEDQVLPANTRSSIFLAKHSPEGKLLWVNKISCEWDKRDFGNALHVDCQGNVYMVGRFERIANFNVPILRATVTAQNHFLAKYHSNGELDWARKIVTKGTDFHTRDVFTDCKGDTYLCLNARLLKYNRYGNRVWEDALRAPGTPQRTRIAVDTAGVLYTFGITAEKREYFILAFEPDGDVTVRWHAKADQKALKHLPAIGADREGNFYISAVAGGKTKAGSSPLSKNRTQTFVAQYGRQKKLIERKPVEMCEGDSVRLYTLEGNDFSYQWYKENRPIIGKKDQDLFVSKAGFYNVLVSSKECKQFSVIQEVRVGCEQDSSPTIEPPITQTEPPSEVIETRSGKPVKLRNRRVKKQKDITLENVEATIYVWDHAAIDNDTISLNINGQWVLQEFGITRYRHPIKVTFKRGQKNYIILYAHNLGSIPPNTLSISIDDGIKSRSMQLKSNMKNCGYLNVELE